MLSAQVYKAFWWTLRPFYLFLGGLLGLPTFVNSDMALYKWLGLGIAIFLFTSAGWFFREVWQARQSFPSEKEIYR